ncbi:MAG TPA: NUDIX hydrolase [Nitrospiria bacterium]|nr:NUDIX hydrolase [Nitrospiria bacterium]
MIDLNLEEAHLPNGKTVQLEMVRHPGASAVVPLQDDGWVVMIRQYRHAAGGMIYEIPAGRLDPGEDPLDCAKRELAEEAGQLAAQWDRLGAVFTTPGFTDEKIHLFLARKLTAVAQALEHDEVIEVVEVPLQEVITMIRQGEVIDGKTICGLMLAYFHIKGVT